ncbi:MAG: hypothetical protein MZV63_15930 [Marinilabiliales bacterium]|nr:hypothetical protein [Marinilabiliales bacterium]
MSRLGPAADAAALALAAGVKPAWCAPRRALGRHVDGGPAAGGARQPPAGAGLHRRDAPAGRCACRLAAGRCACGSRTSSGARR